MEPENATGKAQLTICYAGLSLSLSRLCQATVFHSYVPTPCLFILCVVSFHISLVIPAWKMNTGFVQEL